MKNNMKTNLKKNFIEGCMSKYNLTEEQAWEVFTKALMGDNFKSNQIQEMIFEEMGYICECELGQ